MLWTWRSAIVQKFGKQSLDCNEKDVKEISHHVVSSGYSVCMCVEVNEVHFMAEVSVDCFQM